jgi:hypothetical protein
VHEKHQTREQESLGRARRRPGQTALSVFERDDDADGVTRAAFTKAMGRLFKADRIHTDQIGPPSKRRAKLTPGPDQTKTQTEEA